MTKDPEKRREYHRRWRAANREKHLESQRENKRRWNAANPEQARERNQRYRAANAERLREDFRRRYAADPKKFLQRNAYYYANLDPRKRARREARRRDNAQRQIYGITQSEKDALVTLQNGCACCGRPDPGKHQWQTEHDHATGVIRGITCKLCNGLLAMLGDSLEPARARFAQIEKYLLESPALTAQRLSEIRAAVAGACVLPTLHRLRLCGCAA